MHSTGRKTGWQMMRLIGVFLACSSLFIGLSLAKPSRVPQHNTSTKDEGATPSKPVSSGVANSHTAKPKSHGNAGHRLPRCLFDGACPNAVTFAASLFDGLPISSLILSASFPGQMVFRSPPLLA